MFTKRVPFIAVAISAIGLHAQTTPACSSTAIFTEANNLLAQRNYKKAAQSLDRLRNCPQLTPLATFQMGWLYGRARQFDTAIAVFSRVPADIPDPSTHGYALALSQFELSDYRGAAGTLERLRSVASLDAKAVNLLAVSYSKQGLHAEAYTALNEQLGKDPGDIATHLNLVTVCAEGGDYARAAQLASQAAALFPKSAEVLLVQGAANSMLGRLEEAGQDFAAAVQIAPERADARFFLALVSYDQAQFSQAIATLKKAGQDGLQDSDLHYLMAETLLKANAADSAAALAELNRAVELNPSSAAARTLRGRLLLEKGHPAEAVRDLETANHGNPGSRSTLYNLARAYRAVGKTGQADDLFRQLRFEKPDILKETGDRRLSETLADHGNSR